MPLTVSWAVLTSSAALQRRSLFQVVALVIVDLAADLYESYTTVGRDVKIMEYDLFDEDLKRLN